VIPAVDADQARDAARDILGRGEFRPERQPRPLEGVLRWIGDRLDDVLRPIGDALEDAFAPLFRILPGGWGVALGIAILVGAAALAVWLVARQAVRPAPPSPGTAAAGTTVDDPDDLERQAAAAASAGDFALAVRLRYRAGLVRLDRAHAIRLRASSTTTTVSRTLGSPRFDRLADDFEIVTYGARPGSIEQADTAAREWPRVLDEVGGS
jgi:hypothetical protein